MRTLLLAWAMIALAGCTRQPTVDRLTYFETVQLVDAEQRRLDTIVVAHDKARSETEAAELEGSLTRQGDRVRRAPDLRDAAWEREKERCPTGK